jgi:hypothetical protein
MQFLKHEYYTTHRAFTPSYVTSQNGFSNAVHSHCLRSTYYWNATFLFIMLPDNRITSRCNATKWMYQGVCLRCGRTHRNKTELFITNAIRTSNLRNKTKIINTYENLPHRVDVTSIEQRITRTLNILVNWVVTPYTLVYWCQSFERT